MKIETKILIATCIIISIEIFSPGYLSEFFRFLFKLAMIILLFTLLHQTYSNIFYFLTGNEKYYIYKNARKDKNDRFGSLIWGLILILISLFPIAVITNIITI
jgi:hypothetical protein